MEERNDNYIERRKHLSSMSDARLKEYFYELADKLVDPLLTLGYENTSKSIERSILLRMGFSSLQAKEIVNLLGDNDLLKIGAGHCIYVIYKNLNIDLNRAGEEIIEGKHIDMLKEYFGNNE